MTKSTCRGMLLLAFAFGFVACDGQSPSGPTPPAPSVTAISPSKGSITITPSTDTVNAGDQMSVSWTAPEAGARDWLALFRVGGGYEDDWWDYTNGATSGTRKLTAPTRPGQFEFRCLLKAFSMWRAAAR